MKRKLQPVDVVTAYQHFLCVFSQPRPRVPGSVEWWQTTFHVRGDLCDRCFTLVGTRHL